MCQGTGRPPPVGNTFEFPGVEILEPFTPRKPGLGTRSSVRLHGAKGMGFFVDDLENIFGRKKAGTVTRA